VSRTINASAGKLFALLADTSNHPIIDGSSMVRDARPGVVIERVGDSFEMGMYREDLGNYEMRNFVVEYVDGRRLVWEPIPAALSGPDDKTEDFEPGHYLWGFDLTPVGDDSTVVTETFDCTASPEWLQEATKGGEGWVDAMTATLEKLEALAVQ
jgi:hypothetical protein